MTDRTDPHATRPSPRDADFAELTALLSRAGEIIERHERRLAALEARTLALEGAALVADALLPALAARDVSLRPNDDWLDRLIEGLHAEAERLRRLSRTLPPQQGVQTQAAAEAAEAAAALLAGSAAEGRARPETPAPPATLRLAWDRDDPSTE